MIDQRSDSASELSEFINFHKLTNDYGITRFNASVKFEWDDGTSWIDADVQIERGGFNNYGSVNILSDVPRMFPARFSANFDEMQFDKDKGLKITGVYPMSGLGKYIAYIVIN